MKYILTILVLSCIGCSNNANYLIKKGKVGKINSKSIVKDIDSLFSNDSVVKRIGGGDYMFESEDKYLIYDNLNNHLLTLIPKQQHDANEKIETIQIYSNKFITSKGINIDGIERLNENTFRWEGKYEYDSPNDAITISNSIIKGEDNIIKDEKFFIASSALGDGPKGFSFEASLTTLSGLYSATTSSIDLPGS